MHRHTGILKQSYRCFFSKSSKIGPSDFFKFSEEVSENLCKGNPVVALESTLITHGLPYPENLRTACRLEAIVRENKVTPATIGIIGGKVHIGMNLNELGAISLKNKNLLKISRRDLPFVLSKI
ncbi:hypothetical protein JTE90_006708 [Oedothorax gibbosus]|uniref:Pseudouridine-5'-phosphate glycosidase n=1 Tax=Oedothorax gibbosus TaxID=931172 RepID=A0AAV6TMJ5_9ARAC|nr:hypothetical protein JTE90_006708 [Oedothorax gibbosus]